MTAIKSVISGAEVEYHIQNISKQFKILNLCAMEKKKNNKKKYYKDYGICFTEMLGTANSIMQNRML